MRRWFLISSVFAKGVFLNYDKETSFLMKKALIVIDVQKYFLNDKNRYFPAKVRGYVLKNKDKFDLIVFTNFVNNESAPVYKTLGWRDCLKSPDIDFADELKPALKMGKVFKKSVLSCLKVPKILSLLKKRRITDLYLCGIDTDCCVLATAYDGFDSGYKVNVLRSLCLSTGGKNLHKNALAMVKRNVGFVQ